MKICYIGNAKSIHVKRWTKWFVEHGHEVHLITDRYDEIERVKIHNVKLGRTPVTFIIEAMQVKKLVKKINPDILHAHYVTSYGFFGAFANYHPFVASVWGSDVLRDAKESFVKRMIVKCALKKADIITFTAMFMKNYIAKEFRLPRSKMVRIPWGVDLRIFHRGYEEEVKKLRKKMGIKGDTLVIISNRHMHPKYEIRSIIESIPYVIEKYPKVTFIFIKGNGEESYEKEMEKLASNLGVKDNVKFISKHISPIEMAIYLNLSDILLSIPKTDQFARSIMEGMVCGVIPIVSDIEVYKQYLKDKKNAFFVNPDNPREIADKIIYCIKHSELKEAFYNINRKIIEENEDWNKNAKKMEKLYEKVIGG
ncbi:MAG: glycosyltransferase family 4 protein [Thermoplasmata archaeon]|nr:glycosyltransferase family 4 protein [Thermoplasmata archaeon]